MKLTVEQVLQQGIAAHKEGKIQEAERLYRAIIQSQPLHPHANHNLGVLAVSINKTDKALPLFKTALESNPEIEQFWLSYIDALIKENQFDNAKQALEQAKKQGVVTDGLNYFEDLLIKLTQAPKSKLSEQKKNLSFSEKRKKLAEQKKMKKKKKQNINGISPTQKQLDILFNYYNNGRFNDAEKLAVSITNEFPKNQFGWKVLGAILGAKGRKTEAVDANQKAVALSPQDAESHINLGVTLLEIGRLVEAEASFRQAIALKPDFAEAHTNLGAALEELGRFEDAEASYSQAIALKSDYALAHYGLSKMLYIKGNEDLALNSIVKANEIVSKLKDYELMLSFMKARKSQKEKEAAVSDKNNISAFTGLISNPLILNRLVEAELITSLYEMNSIQLNKKKGGRLLAPGKGDPRYGNGIVSSNFSLFDDDRSIIQKVAEDLTKIMMEAVQSDIYIYDSFFNILRAGGGAIPHAHLSGLDKNIALGLGKRKYSLVYYLSVGDQNCIEPGILKLYEPEEDILPCEGMILIIPASREHSVVYSGKTDRVMIGVNFYSL